jgi:hypothetical protein
VRRLGLGQHRLGGLDGPVGLGQRGTQPLDLGRGVLRLRPRRCARAVVLGLRPRVRAGCCVRLVRTPACVLDGAARGLEARGRVLGVGRDRVASGHGVVALRDELDARGHALPAAGHADRTDEVA